MPTTTHPTDCRCLACELRVTLPRDDAGLVEIARQIGGDLDPHGMIHVEGSAWFRRIIVDQDVTYRVGLYVDGWSDSPVALVEAPTVDDAVAAVRVLRLVVLTHGTES